MRKKLNIHVLMHVNYEGLGCIEEWTTEHKHQVSYTRFYESYTLPDLSLIDWLIVMGGPMGIYDTYEFPWLNDEKKFISKAIQENKTVLGICLGSQLIADVLGSKVFSNKQKEIGWFNIKLTEQAKNVKLTNSFDPEFTVFHWHGDTFDLPQDSTQLFYSEACRNQGYIYKDKVLGIQFHFEATEKTLIEMVENGKAELIENSFIQSAELILKSTEYIKINNQRMFQLLDNLSHE